MTRNFEAVVFDMDGTLYTGESVIPGARELLAALTARGTRVCYFTNNSSRCGADYARRLAGFGFPAAPESIVTSGDVALDYVLTRYPGRRVLVFGTPSLRGCFSEAVELDDERPEVAVMGFHNEMTYPELVRLCNALRTGIPYIATHPDKNCPAEPYPVPDAGSFAALVESATGRVPDAVCGKPSATAGAYLCRRLNLSSDKIAFVGDRYSTDILLAKHSGFYSVHVQTGAREDPETEGPADLVLPSVANLLDYL